MQYTDQDWELFLIARESKSGAHRLAGTLANCNGILKGASRDRVTDDGDVSLDAGRMSLTAWISTPDIDRSEDVVEPDAFTPYLDNYARNPICFFDHGQDQSPALPIGQSADQDGRLTLKTSPEGVQATLFFSQSLPLAAQVFALWQEKVLRAVSVNFIPKRWEVRPGTGPANPEDGRPGMHVLEAELLEWGPVSIPDNPFAVAKILSRGRLDGRPIQEPLLGMLKRYAPIRRAYTNGIAKDATASAGPAQTPPGQPAKELPFGARALRDAHKQIRGLSEQIKKTVRRLEHQQVKTHLQGLCDALDGHADGLAKAFAASYKDFGELSSSRDDDGGNTVKNFLASGKSIQRQFAEQSQALKRLIVEPNLTPSQQEAIQNAFERLDLFADGLEREAKSRAAARVRGRAGADDPAVVKAASQIVGQMSSVAKALQGIVGGSSA